MKDRSFVMGTNGQSIFLNELTERTKFKVNINTPIPEILRHRI